VEYWDRGFDWERQVETIDALPHYMANVDGTRVHFFHLRSPHAGALPLLLLHGWPSSNVEFLAMADRLLDPVAFGGESSDAFDLVIPSLPGFALSTPANAPWDAMRTAGVLRMLMRSLGYSRFGVHGGDIGADVAGELNHVADELVGVHVSTDTAALYWFARFTGQDPMAATNISDRARVALERVASRGARDGGYLEIQRTRPTTIGYLLDDSPAGLLAWIVEKFRFWTGRGDGLPEDRIDLDQLLTNVTLWWLGQAGSSAARFLCHNMAATRDWGRPSLAPMGMTLFGADAAASVLQPEAHRPPYWRELAAGGHFPALEFPELLAEELQSFFRTVRSGRTP
jgi:pimeloyl-ACP methyl ester carboxylesterase